MIGFAGKAAMVSGAGGGMGLNIANDLIAAGANVTLLDLKPRPRGLPEGPGRCLYHQGDVSDEGFVAGAVAATVEAFGGLHYLVNCAGVLWFDRDASVLDIELKTWDRVLEINLKSVAIAARHAIPAMRRSGGGAMVHFSSIQALRGDPRPQDAYAASKGALRSLSKSLAIQFAEDGIRSNLILPGATASPLQARWAENPELEAAAAERIPLRRVGTTQDMADACLFLLSDKASYITGAELVVDGGATALP